MKNVVLLNSKGCQFPCKVEFCDCEEETVTLFKLGYFPATPVSPLLAVSMNLLLWLEALALEGHLSVLDFCKSILYVNQDYNDDIKQKRIYPALIDCFEEYRYLRHVLRYGDASEERIDCPACPKTDGVLTVGVDACFGLPRKVASGDSYRAPLHKEAYFAQQQEVMEFCQSNPASVVDKEEECSDFKAASYIRSKGKFQGLAETAVMGVACKHGIPLDFINLTTGERFHYVLFLLKRITEDCVSRGVNVNLFYDVGCQFKRYLVNNGHEDIMESVNIAVPVFHAYGHKVTCQIQYNPRNLEGWGLCDGEMLERLWSYLRNFNKTTKEMAPSHRIDVLSSALYHVAAKIKETIGIILVRNMTRAQNTRSSMIEELGNLYLKSQVPLNEEVVRTWATEEKQNILDINPAVPPQAHWQNDYIELIDKWLLFRDALSKVHSTDKVSADVLLRHVNRLNSDLIEMEEKHGIQKRWSPTDPAYMATKRTHSCNNLSLLRQKIRAAGRRYWFCKTLLRKYSDGQAVAKRLSGALNKESAGVKKLLHEHNKLIESFQSDLQPLTFANATDMESTLYSDGPVTVDDVPMTVKRKAVSCYNLLARSGEEITFIKLEMRNVLQSFIMEYHELCEKITSHQDQNICPGKTSLLIKQQQKLARRLHALANQLSEHIQLPVEAMSFLSNELGGEESDVFDGVAEDDTFWWDSYGNDDCIDECDDEIDSAYGSLLEFENK